MNNNMHYSVTLYNVHVNDSYKIRRCKIFSSLNEIEEKDGKNTLVFDDRSHFSLGMEWTVHNVLYRLGYKREQTKDVDMDDPCDKPAWLYGILGVLCWIFLWFLI